MSAVVEWQITGACNYRCSYCIQGTTPKHGYQPTAVELNAAMDVLTALPGSWEIKISGGEPFQSKHFLDLVLPRLMRESSHTVSILTNLSASEEELTRFVEITEGRLRVLSVSFHPEFVTLDDFLDRAIFLKGLVPEKSRIKVNMVLLPGKIFSHFRLRRKIARAGLHYYGQYYKIKGKVWNYSWKDRLALRLLLGWENSPHQINKAPSYQGHYCEAGLSYFVVQKEGDAWICRTAKRFNQFFLGNIYKGTFSLRSAGLVCPFTICPCSVPHNRGLIQEPPKG